MIRENHGKSWFQWFQCSRFTIFIFTRYICTASLHHCITAFIMVFSPGFRTEMSLCFSKACLAATTATRGAGPTMTHHDPPWPTMTHLMGAKLLRCSIQTPCSRIACIWASVPYPWHRKCNLNQKKTMHPASAIQKCISGPLMAMFTRFHKCITGGCFGLRLEDESGLYVVLIGDGAQRTNRHRSIGGHWAVPQAPESRTKAKRLQKLFGSGKSTTLHSAFRHVQTCSDMFKEFHQFCTELQYEQNPVAPTLWALKP